MPMYGDLISRLLSGLYPEGLEPTSAPPPEEQEGMNPMLLEQIAQYAQAREQGEPPAVPPPGLLGGDIELSEQLLKGLRGR